MKKLLLPALLVMIYFSSCKSTSEIVSLKLQMPVGNTYEYTFVMDMNMDQNVMGQQMKISNKMTMGYVFEVLKDSAGWKTMRSTIGRIRMDMDMMGRTMTIDSNEPVSDTIPGSAQMYNAFAGMKGKQFTFTINDKGQVGEVKGLKEMRESIVKDMPDGDKVDQQLESSFNEESFKQNLEQSFNIFPDKDVAVGDSWKKTMNMKSQGMNIKSENTYTLESIKDGKAHIKVKTGLSTDKTTAENGMEITMKGTGDGVYTFEQSTGMVMDGDVKMKMDMEMSMNGQKMPMKMDMNIKLDGKKR
jgi:hypothetical protein